MKHISEIDTGPRYAYIGELFETSIGVVEFWADSLDCPEEDTETCQCDKCVLCSEPDCIDAVCTICSTPESLGQNCRGYFRKPVRRGV